MFMNATANVTNLLNVQLLETTDTSQSVLLRSSFNCLTILRPCRTFLSGRFWILHIHTDECDLVDNALCAVLVEC